jgi:hypothetical protein
MLPHQQFTVVVVVDAASLFRHAARPSCSIWFNEQVAGFIWHDYEICSSTEHVQGACLY